MDTPYTPPLLVIYEFDQDYSERSSVTSDHDNAYVDPDEIP